MFKSILGRFRFSGMVLCYSLTRILVALYDVCLSRKDKAFASVCCSVRDILDGDTLLARHMPSCCTELPSAFIGAWLRFGDRLLTRSINDRFMPSQLCPGVVHCDESQLAMAFM